MTESCIYPQCDREFYWSLVCRRETSLDIEHVCPGIWHFPFISIKSLIMSHTNMPGNHDGVFNFSIVLGTSDFRYFDILVYKVQFNTSPLNKSVLFHMWCYNQHFHFNNRKLRYVSLQNTSCVCSPWFQRSTKNMIKLYFLEYENFNIFFCINDNIFCSNEEELENSHTFRIGGDRIES